MNKDYQGPQYTNVATAKAISADADFNTVAVTEEVKGDGEVFRKYGLLSLIFGIIFTFCLYKNPSGITYPIFMVCAISILYFIRKKDGYSLIASRSGKKALSIFYIVSLLLLSIHKCLSNSGNLIRLDTVAIFLLYFSFLIHLYVDTTDWDIAAWFEGILLTIVSPFSVFLKPIFDLVDCFKSRNSNITSERKQTVSAVVIGLVCAIPMLVIIISLLSSADAVFSRLLEKVLESFHLPENIWDIVGIAFMFVISCFGAYLIPYVLGRDEIKIHGRKQGNNNPVIAITFTGLIGLVYLVFCLIQVMFLFTKTISLPTGYTYAKYAHEGFYQLLTVCIINLVIVSVCNRAFKQSKILAAILVIIAACTYIMIASSATRMLLYIGVYNLTFLRLFVLWFLAVLCIWLAFLMVGIFNKKFPIFKACMTVITIAYITLAFSNPEYQIAKYDLKAVEGGKVEQYQSIEDYIVNDLSTDAVPALVSNEKLLHRYELYMISRERDGITPKHNTIRSFNFSHYRAKQIYK